MGLLLQPSSFRRSEWVCKRFDKTPLEVFYNLAAFHLERWKTTCKNYLLTAKNSLEKKGTESQPVEVSSERYIRVKCSRTLNVQRDSWESLKSGF